MRHATEMPFFVLGPLHGRRVPCDHRPNIIGSWDADGPLVYVRTLFWRHGLPSLPFYVPAGSDLDEMTEAVMRLLRRPVVTAAVPGVGWIRL